MGTLLVLSWLVKSLCQSVIMLLTAILLVTLSNMLATGILKSVYPVSVRVHEVLSTLFGSILYNVTNGSASDVVIMTNMSSRQSFSAPNF